MSTETLRFDDGGGVPNYPDLPVVILRGALVKLAPEDLRKRIEGNGWGGSWIWTVFDYHHFHPDAHETLAVVAGTADLALGGPSGRTVHVGRGDCLVLPAGTGHKRVAASPDFRVCGAYPPGQERFETLREGEGPDDLRARIVAVPLPRTDPTTGAAGPLTEIWT